MSEPDPRSHHEPVAPSVRHPQRLLSPQELADYLEVPVKTIYSWLHHNKGPQGFRVGKHIRFRWHDVQVWLSDQIAEER